MTLRLKFLTLPLYFVYMYKHLAEMVYKSISVDEQSLICSTEQIPENIGQVPVLMHRAYKTKNNC